MARGAVVGFLSVQRGLSSAVVSLEGDVGVFEGDVLSFQPGKPVQNAHVESFNGRFRDECLSQAHYPSLARARVRLNRSHLRG